MKALHIFLKIILTLLLISPILGALGIFPAPTADMYSNLEAFAFIQMMMNTYLVYAISITCLLVIMSIWSKREALGALLLLPLSANIIAFHATLDGGLFTAGAIMADVLILINIYLLWKNKSVYKSLVSRQ